MYYNIYYMYIIMHMSLTRIRYYIMFEKYSIDSSYIWITYIF